MAFSVFGLSFIFAFGAFVILVSYIMEPLTNRVKHHLKQNPYASVEWRAMQKLHLQRLAHQGIGFGHWSNGYMDVPVTLPEEDLAVIDVTDPKVPRLIDSTCSSPESLYGMVSNDDQQVSVEHVSVHNKQPAPSRRSSSDPDTGAISEAGDYQSQASCFQIHSIQNGSTFFVGADQIGLGYTSDQFLVKPSHPAEEKDTRAGNYV
jgi:hypothetical protein